MNSFFLKSKSCCFAVFEFSLILCIRIQFSFVLPDFSLKYLRKAVVNEDTQGNVNQLQAEVKKLKEQLAQLTSVPSMRDISVAQGTSWGGGRTSCS